MKLTNILQELILENETVTPAQGEGENMFYYEDPYVDALIKVTELGIEIHDWNIKGNAEKSLRNLKQKHGGSITTSTDTSNPYWKVMKQKGLIDDI